MFLKLLILTMIAISQIFAVDYLDNPQQFKEEQLKVTIKFIRGFIQGGVLAVSTTQNYKWTFKYLLEHLVEEREWFEANKRK